jgi:hypothetical protein
MATIIVTSISTSCNSSDLKQLFEVMCPSMECLELGIGVDNLMAVVRVTSKEMV